MVAEDRYVHTKRAKKNRSGKGGKAPKTQTQLDAARGKFDFTEINGFKLKEVEWTVPDKQTRKRRRRAFNAVREEFLKHIGKTQEPALRDLGLTDNRSTRSKKATPPSDTTSTTNCRFTAAARTFLKT